MTTATTPLRSQILTFVLAGEEYGVDILRVREIIQYSRPTRVPGMPPAMRGLINLRGRVVPGRLLRAGVRGRRVRAAERGGDDEQGRARAGCGHDGRA